MYTEIRAPRQSGKTTLLRNCLERALMFRPRAVWFAPTYSMMVLARKHLKFATETVLWNCAQSADDIEKKLRGLNYDETVIAIDEVQLAWEAHINESSFRARLWELSDLGLDIFATWSVD